MPFRYLYSGYKEHGELDECFDGEGGHDAMNVYNITGNIQGINGIIVHSSLYFSISHWLKSPS